jgi:hypothetical protein
MLPAEILPPNCLSSFFAVQSSIIIVYPLSLTNNTPQTHFTILKIITSNQCYFAVVSHYGDACFATNLLNSLFPNSNYNISQIDSKTLLFMYNNLDLEVEY